MNENETVEEYEYNPEAISYYEKNKIIGGFIDVIMKYGDGISSYAEHSPQLDYEMIDSIPNDIIEEYEEARLRFEYGIKKIIKKIEELPTYPLIRKGEDGEC